MPDRKYPVFELMLLTLPIHLFVAGLLNYDSWGYMIGQTYFNEYFGVFDLMFDTTISAAVPSLVSGALIARLEWRYPAWWSRSLGFMVFAFAVCCSHTLYFREVRSLCCGATW